jgi:iduronate 2-sulfatase
LFDGELADMAVAALADRKDKTQPFFLAVGFIRPHLPFIAPQKYWDLYDPAKIELAPNPFRPKDAPSYAFAAGDEVRSYANAPKGQHIPDDYARQLKHGYFAAVSYMDAQVGRVLAELDRLGLRENTIVVLWGDHGWKLGEHDAWAKHSNVENDIRVPLVISVPSMTNAGKSTNALVEFVDVYPTLAELAGSGAAETSRRHQLQTIAPGAAAPVEDGRVQPVSAQESGQQNLMGYTLRTDRYRFTRWVHRTDQAKVEAVELYDHQTDPQENANIANDPKNQALVETLTAQWQAGWRGALPK